MFPVIIISMLILISFVFLILLVLVTLLWILIPAIFCSINLVRSWERPYFGQ